MKLGDIFKKNNTKTGLIGLDISTTSVKLLELIYDGQKYKVESFAVEPLPPQVIVDKNIVDVELVGEAIAKAIKKARPTTKNAAVAVAGSAVITKLVEMDSNLNDEEREIQIRLDADQYIPYPLAEINLDFEVIGPVAGNASRSIVLLAAARSDQIEQRQDALEIGGAVAKVVDIEAYAIERAVNLMLPGLPGLPQVVAVVDIGHTVTTLHVFHQGQIIYTREQAFGGKLLTEDIMRRYGLSFEEATRAKKAGTLPSDYQYEVLSPYMESVVQQVSRALSFFFSSSQYNDIDHVVLCGGGAEVTGLAALIQERMGNPVSLANPFVNMTYSGKFNLGQLEAEAPSLMIACGLAMRSLNNG